MWQQDMALIEERRKRLESEAAHIRLVQEVQRQQSHHNSQQTLSQAQVGNPLTLINRLLRTEPETARLKAKKV